MDGPPGAELIARSLSIAVEAQHVSIAVTDAQGRSRLMPSLVIETDTVAITTLAPGESAEAGTTVFWGSHGFAFVEPGRHDVEVSVTWTVSGVPVGARAATPVWVAYPLTEADDEAAATLLHPDVGMYVALGGGADHLTEAVERLERVAAADDAGQTPRALRGMRAFMPTRGRRGAGGGRKTASRQTRGRQSSARKGQERKPR